MPWEDWYHIMGHTYGTWLPGDPKGFRARHHREHVEGDYKNPPPAGLYDGRWKKAKELMKREPVHLDMEQRRRAVEEVVKSFTKWGIEFRIIGIDRIHFHVLARVPDHNPRHWMGPVKKECSAYMKRGGLAPDGGLWAVRWDCLPIENAWHCENVDGYIRDYELQGAVIWPPSKNGMDDFDPDCLLL